MRYTRGLGGGRFQEAAGDLLMRPFAGKVQGCVPVGVRDVQVGVLLQELLCNIQNIQNCRQPAKDLNNNIVSNQLSFGDRSNLLA